MPRNFAAVWLSLLVTAGSALAANPPAGLDLSGKVPYVSVCSPPRRQLRQAG